MKSFSKESGAVRLASAATSDQTGLAFDLITDIADIRALAPAWRDLEARVTEQFNYFQTYEWCESWFAQFGEFSMQLPQVRGV